VGSCRIAGRSMLMSWAMMRDLRWGLKLNRKEKFLMEVGIEFHVAGEL